MILFVTTVLARVWLVLLAWIWGRSWCRGFRGLAWFSGLVRLGKVGLLGVNRIVIRFWIFLGFGLVIRSFACFFGGSWEGGEWIGSSTKFEAIWATCTLEALITFLNL